MNKPERKLTEISFNRRARRNYEVLDTLEVGISLSGTEVKTLRGGKVSLEEAFVKLQDDALWLFNAHIAEYEAGNIFNHEPARPRRLLSRKREARKLGHKVKVQGLTIIPLRMYFRGKWAKLEIALARGRRMYDKRNLIKERESKRKLRGLNK